MLADDIICGKAVCIRIGDFAVSADAVRIKNGHFVEEILRSKDAGCQLFVHVYASLRKKYDTIL